MEIRVLKNFLAVASEGNITAAANSLHISQSALSRQMLDLEQELDTQLFVRTNRSSDLTLDGLRFRERARQIVELSENTVNEFADRETKLSGEIRICADESPAMDIIAKAVTSLCAKHPGITVAVVSAATDASVYYLDEDTMDLALILEPFDTNRYDSIPLMKRERLGVLMRSDDPSAGSETLTIDQLKQMRLIVFHRYINPRFPKKLDVSRKDLHITGTYTLITTAVSLVQNRFANALCVERDSSAYERLGLVFRPVVPEVNYEAVLAWRRHHLLSPQALALIEEVKSLTGM